MMVDIRSNGHEPLQKSFLQGYHDQDNEPGTESACSTGLVHVRVNLILGVTRMHRFSRRRVFQTDQLKSTTRTSKTTEIRTKHPTHQIHRHPPWPQIPTDHIIQPPCPSSIQTDHPQPPTPNPQPPTLAMAPRQRHRDRDR